MLLLSFIWRAILTFLFEQLTKPILTAKIKRHWDLKLESDKELAASQPKQPSLSNKTLDAITNILKEPAIFGSGKVAVMLHDHDKEFVKRMLVQVLDYIQEVNSAREEADCQNGSHIISSTLAKLRAIEALFHEDNRPALIRMYDSQSVHEVDARNSVEHSTPSVYEQGAARYGMQAWVPMSMATRIHQDLKTSVALVLVDDALPVPKNFENMIKSIVTQYKKASEGYKKSGNGDGELF